MLEAVWIAFAFTLGFLVHRMGLPNLIGYLAAGFAISAVAPALNLPEENGEILDHIAHLGVLLLLFTVGLKLRLRNLVRPEVIGGGLLHFTVSCLVLAPAFYLFMDVSPYTAGMLAVALAFSSTVLAAKVLDSKRELRAFHGRVAIGILIVQDLIALVVMAFANGETPSWWALLIFALPLLRPVFYRLLDMSGHDELLMLLGLLMALAVGGQGFESVGLSSELGALAFGALLANHPRATELSNSLWSVKELFLVGFFLQIGMEGLPDADMLIFAAIMTLVLPLKGLLFFFLLLAFKLRARSAFLTGLSLSNYSEFGLIVASVALPDWLVPIAITLAFSFVLSAPLNHIAHPLYEKLANRLQKLERDSWHPDEQPISLGDAEVVVMGMGRTGAAAYERLQKQGYQLIALDSDPGKVDKHRKAGRNILFADAEDQAFWQGLDMTQIKAVVLSMSDSEAKIISAKKLRSNGFEGYIVSHSLYEDEANRIDAAGANRTYLTMNEAGTSLAEHICQYMQTGKADH